MRWHRWTAMVGTFTLGCAGCRASPQDLPRASFLVAAGDSTFWVDGTADGFEVRRAPILLARLDGRFHELYVVERDYSFEDALLIGQAVYRRDLVSGDSVLVREDRHISAIAARWQRRHPSERPLEPDEEVAEEPGTHAATDTELTDVAGPYLSYEFHLDVDAEREPHVHQTRRGVVDLRNSTDVSLAQLVDSATARRAMEEGRQRFRSSVDSVRSATDARAARAREVVGAFRFDPASFELMEMDREMAVLFYAPGEGPRAGGYALALGDVSIGRPPWVRLLDDTRPTQSDTQRLIWRDTTYAVVATALPGGNTARVEVLRGNARHVVTEVPTPVRRIFRLGNAPSDTPLRAALLRAFDLWGSEARVAPTRASPARVGVVWSLLSTS